MQFQILTQQMFYQIAVQGLTGNVLLVTLIYKLCNLQFRTNQLVTLFRNLPCSTTNLLTVVTERISVALNTSGVTCAIPADVSNVL